MGTSDFARGGGSTGDGSKLFDASLASLDLAMQMASPFITEKVTAWDLDDPHLMLTLGYMSGWIDAAYQMTRPVKYNEQFVDKAFSRSIAKYLSSVPGVEAYLQVATMDDGGSTIAGLQGDPKFMEGTMAGGRDFVGLVNDKRPPISLAQMLSKGESTESPQPVEDHEERAAPPPSTPIRQPPPNGLRRWTLGAAIAGTAILAYLVAGGGGLLAGRSYDDCILENVPKAADELAIHMTRQACLNKYPERKEVAAQGSPNSMSGEGGRWEPIDPVEVVDVYFDAGSTEISPANQAKIARAAVAAKNARQRDVAIWAYFDVNSSAVRDKELALKRVDALREALLALGVSDIRPFVSEGRETSRVTISVHEN